VRTAIIESGDGNRPGKGPEISATTLNREGGEPITVLVVDDHDGFRMGLAEMLTAHGLEVVGDAPDGETALSLVEALAPDVVLMDLQMPGLHGIETTRRIAKSSPASAVLILTVSAQEDDIVDAMLIGASGYLVKGSSPEAVVAGIEAAARGQSMISAEVASKLFARLRADGAGRPEDESPLSFLSAREIEVLRLLAAGRHNDDIANELVISPFTVRNHISNLLRKLHVDNRTQAAAYAIRHGL
jgi:NarL family two-component system response regulator LiaR